jgi:hypothetical protein
MKVSELVHLEETLDSVVRCRILACVYGGVEHELFSPLAVASHSVFLEKGKVYEVQPLLLLTNARENAFDLIEISIVLVHPLDLRLLAGFLFDLIDPHRLALSCGWS